MGKLLNEISELTIDNYLKANEELKYDGSFINHFASMIYTSNNNDLNSKVVKEIRKYIKNNTNRMSAFRGDILYILSILIGATVDKWKEFTDELLKTYDKLVEENLEESSYLVISAYILCKHNNRGDLNCTLNRIKSIYKLLKNKDYNVTNKEDYVICTILAIGTIEINTIDDFLDGVEGAFDEEELSNNEVQGVATALVLNKGNYDAVNMLLEEFEKRDIKISNKFLPLIGAINFGKDIAKYVDKVEDVIEYLCDEESSYEFFMDKSFRTLISINIIESCKKSRRFKYMDELIAFGVYSYIVSKNQGIFEESLA